MNLIRPSALALVAALFAPAGAVPAPVPAGAKDTPKSELAKLAGTWKVVSYQRAGVERINAGNQEDMILEIEKDGTFEWTAGATGRGAIAHIDPTKKVKEADYTYSFKNTVEKAIYKLDDDTFTDCFDTTGETRPTEFSSTVENGYFLMVCKRVKPTN